MKREWIDQMIEVVVVGVLRVILWPLCFASNWRRHGSRRAWLALLRLLEVPDRHWADQLLAVALVCFTQLCMPRAARRWLRDADEWFRRRKQEDMARHRAYIPKT